MPGLVIWINVKEGINLNLFEKALQLMIHDDDYYYRIVLAEDKAAIGYVSYPGYPIETHSKDGINIIIEGMIFSDNIDNSKKELEDSLMLYFTTGKCHNVIDWVKKARGEFNIIAYDNKHRYIIVPDQFNLLKLFYFESKDAVVIAREIKTVSKLVNLKSISRRGIIEHIAFGLPTGNGTLFNEIKKYPYGKIMQLMCDQNKLTIQTEMYYHLRFNDGGEIIDNNAILKDLHDNLLNIFQLITTTHKGRKNVLALSGGLDSRLIACALKELGVSFSAYTSMGPMGDRFKEVIYGKEVAKRLNIPHYVISAPGTKESNKYNVWISDATSNLNFGYSNNIFRIVKNIYSDNSVVFYGVFANSLFQRHPEKYLTDKEEEIIDSFSAFSLNEVCELFEFDKDYLIQSLKENIKNQSHKNFETNVFVYFKLDNYMANFTTYGLERHKKFLWAIDPYIQLGDYLLMLPVGFKKRLLYIDYHRKYCSKVSDIPNYDLNLSPNNKLYKLYFNWNKFLASSNLKTVRRYIKQYKKYPKNKSISGNESVREYSEIMRIIHPNYDNIVFDENKYDIILSVKYKTVLELIKQYLQKGVITDLEVK